jgi:hypothetical protein
MIEMVSSAYDPGWALPEVGWETGTADEPEWIAEPATGGLASPFAEGALAEVGAGRTGAGEHALPTERSFPAESPFSSEVDTVAAEAAGLPEPWLEDRFGETPFDAGQEPMSALGPFPEETEEPPWSAGFEGETSPWSFEDDAGQQWETKPATDAVDPFLDSRTRLFKVAIVGTSIRIARPSGQDWTANYTRRALDEAAVLAAMRTLYDPKLQAAKVRTAWQTLVGHQVKYIDANDAAVQVLVIEDPQMTKIAVACGFETQSMLDAWRKQRGAAKLIEFALGSAYKSFANLEPHLPAKELAARRMPAALIRHLLDRWSQSMIEVAKRHPAAKPWRDAFARNAALTSAQREPKLEDLPRATWGQWAKVILELAVATRAALAQQLERDRADARRHALNEHLRPHEIAVDDAAAFILRTFDATPYGLDQYGWKWIVHGGQTLSNAKNQQIFLLRADGNGVIYQNLVDTKFYKQSLDGFVQELVYGIYTAAGQKSMGAIALSQWVLGIAGAVFFPVRFGLLATDVLNAAFKLKANQAELERTYESVKLAYANIDRLLPGVLPKVWDAVLDKRNVTLFNPLQHPDLGAWLKVVIRLVIARQARVAKASYAAEAVDGFLRTAWAAISKGLGAVAEIVKHVIILGPAVVGSTGVRGGRALQLAEQRLKELGVRDAAAITLQIGMLSAADQQRLVREIEDLGKNGKGLVQVIKKSLSW